MRFWHLLKPVSTELCTLTLWHFDTLGAGLEDRDELLVLLLKAHNYSYQFDHLSLLCLLDHGGNILQKSTAWQEPEKVSAVFDNWIIHDFHQHPRQTRTTGHLLLWPQKTAKAACLPFYVPLYQVNSLGLAKVSGIVTNRDSQEMVKLEAAMENFCPQAIQIPCSWHITDLGWNHHVGQIHLGVTK